MGEGAALGSDKMAARIAELTKLSGGLTGADAPGEAPEVTAEGVSKTLGDDDDEEEEEEEEGEGGAAMMGTSLIAPTKMVVWQKCSFALRNRGAPSRDS